MAIMRVTKYGEKVLHHRAKPVTTLGEETQALIRDMYETMYASNGIGLAASQVGVSLQLAVVNTTPETRANQFVIINPKIVYKKNRVTSEEGCLSLPGVGSASIQRYNKVTVNAINEKGLPIEIKGEGLLSFCLQHEIDHVNGIMIINRASIKKALEMRWTIRKLKKDDLW